MKLVLKLLFVLSCCFAAYEYSAAQEITPQSEQEIENRARKIGESLRCVVCQNQSIDESNAPLAADMRVLVRDRLREGDSNEQVILYMRDRYGDFVLLKPPFQANTILLWLAPISLIFILFIWYFWRAKRKNPVLSPSPLSEEEKRQFNKLAKKQDKAS